MGDADRMDVDTDEMLNRNRSAFKKLRSLVSAMKSVVRFEQLIYSAQNKDKNAHSSGLAITEAHGRKI
jgi:hypothetical protein